MPRFVRTLVAISLLVGSPLAAQAQSQQEANKKTVVAFYEAAINQKDFDAASNFDAASKSFWLMAAS